MENLTSDVSKIITEMKSKGRIEILSHDKTAAFEQNLAKKLKEIRKDYKNKEKNSRAYVAQMELSSINGINNAF